jgi:hypothetical protein
VIVLSRPGGVVVLVRWPVVPARVGFVSVIASCAFVSFAVSLSGVSVAVFGERAAPGEKLELPVMGAGKVDCRVLNRMCQL